jgi:FtsP/CotA-like multicopper oxidase with cupredoxin domain
VVEWAVTGVNAHPFHLHVNPFQIASINAASEYFQVRAQHASYLPPSLRLRWLSEAGCGACSRGDSCPCHPAPAMRTAASSGGSAAVLAGQGGRRDSAPAMH